MPNNVFEGLDEILARQKRAEEQSRREHEEILEAINKSNSKAKSDSMRRDIDYRNSGYALEAFLKRAYIESMWFGSDAMFKKEKKKSLLWILCSIIGMVICTMVTPAALGEYGACTLLENVILIMMLFSLKKVGFAKRIMPGVDYISQECLDNTGFISGIILRTINFAVKVCVGLGYVAFACNAFAPYLDDYTSRIFPLLILVLEIGTLVVVIIARRKVKSFIERYTLIRYCGWNESRTGKIVLINDTLMGKLYYEEDFFRTFPLAR